VIPEVRVSPSDYSLNEVTMLAIKAMSNSISITVSRAWNNRAVARLTIPSNCLWSPQHLCSPESITVLPTFKSALTYRLEHDISKSAQ